MVLLVAAVFVALIPGVSRAANVCAPSLARIVSLQGTVELRPSESEPWTDAALGDQLCVDYWIRIGPFSRAALVLPNDSVLRLDQQTTLRLRAPAEEARSLLDLFLGTLYLFSHRPRALEVDTPFVNAATEGTEFLLSVGADQTQIIVFEGRVLAQNPDGELLLASGEAAVAAAGEAPRTQIVARPRDTVAWTLYYPPILAALAERAPSARGLPPGLQAAVDGVAANDYQGALEALDAVPDAARDARYWTYRAGVLLNVGRVDGAQAAIEQALRLDPDAGEALAQRAIIAVVQNRKEQALTDARRAVNLSPGSSAARIALSYALQANFQLGEARAVLREAVGRDPEDALAWARLAELQLMFGELGAAQDAAERAVALAPELSRTQMVLGFAALTRIDIDEAKAAFDRAIELESAEPLARLGLGLAIIRSGHLEEGRKEIEISAGLDPNDSLIRSYLGKAYFEEKRGPLDAEQFAIAKELDPNDPTPWLYDGIRLQTENRPVAGLHNLQRSFELNENRVVYRSRLELDSDRASRGNSIARVYQDLGFERLGINLSADSIDQDPSNPGAHRFLSDSYIPIRRYEIARVSELLQAQLLQDININPVQPSLSETNLNIVARGGPIAAGLNEYNPLFERNQLQVNTTGLIGNNQTSGAEGIASAIYNRLSISAGAFTYNTNGWRDNGNIDQDIQDVFAQWAVTPELNVQAEFRHRDTNTGDLEQRFDRSDFDTTLSGDIDQKTARFGLRYSPIPSSDFLLSYIYNDREEGLDETQSGIFPVIPPIPFTAPTDNHVKDHAHQVEGQSIYKRERFNLIVGGAFSKVDRHFKSRTRIFGLDDLEPVIPGISSPTSSSSHSDVTHPRGYLYGNFNFPEPVTWTVGVSYDDYKEDDFHEQKINPKFGIRWNILENLQFRAAWFETLKPALANNQTIEPTQIAGFNQFFDDLNATKSTRYGFALDHQLTPDLSFGAETTWRHLDEPQFFGNEAIKQDRDEQTHRAYAFWTPWSELALGAEFVYDRFKAQKGDETVVPKKVTTVGVPVWARYFWRNGLFAGVGATLVYQDVDRFEASTFNDGDDRFVVFDATAGYRLPKRFGVFSVGVQNVFGRNFNFQDDSYREFGDQPSTGPYIPDFQIVGRLTINLDFFGWPPFSGRQ